LEVRVKEKRFTEEQIAYALAQESTGQSIAQICRKPCVPVKEIAAVRPSWGSPRIHVLLRREGWLVDHKRTERLCRLCRLEGLNLRRNRPRRSKSVVTRGPSVAPTRRDERWSMLF
jgi:transposase InsO family protein